MDQILPILFIVALPFLTWFCAWQLGEITEKP